MSTILSMPRMGETMESGRVVAWLKRPGDAFKRGEVILEIETDKTTVEMPALDDGRLVEILAGEGTDVAVGAALGRYESGAPAAPPPAAAVAKVLAMPRMGETMEEGRVVAWLKQPGEMFRRGEVIVEIETDKTTVEVPALDDGRLVAVVAQPGDTVAVGQPIGRYTSDAAVPVAAVSVAAAAPAPAGPRPVEAAAPVGRTADAGPTERLRATPLARRLARNAGLDLATLTGSGRRARIETRDVEAALADLSPATDPQAPTSTPDLRFVDLPAGRMAYREWAGAGKRGTLLVLHGFSADGATWAGLAAALARQGFRVVAPDLPGHGATAIEAVSIDDVVAAVTAFAAALDLGTDAVVAHSMGAAVAVRAVVAGGLRPSRLTLVAPAGLGGAIDADFVNGMAHVGSGGALAHLLRRLARRVPALSRPQLDRMAAAFARGRLKGLAGALVENGRQALDIVPDLQALTVPTRIVWGIEDAIIPWTQVAQAPSRIPVHLVAGAGHMPHWDAPNDLLALLS